MDIKLSEKTKENMARVFGLSYEELVSMSEDEREKLINSLKKETKKAKKEVNKKYEYLKSVEKLLNTKHTTDEENLKNL